MNICVLIDNLYLYKKLKYIIKDFVYETYKFDFFCSYNNLELIKLGLDGVNLKKTSSEFYEKYDLFLSVHCKQVFPKELVNTVRCINIHPGYNPYNRGWFPQVFSIINKKPMGVTIHEMDEKLDHGPIIVQEIIEIKQYETSGDVYRKIQEKEVELLEKTLPRILENLYETTVCEIEGNINKKKDFSKLCKIDLAKEATYGEVIDFLRAMTHDEYANAYFEDTEGNKVYVKIKMEVK